MKRWIAALAALAVCAGLGWGIRPLATRADDSTASVQARVPLVAADTAPSASPSTPAPISNTVPVTVRDADSSATLSVEVASTEQQREAGLMNRASLPADGGMLFLSIFQTTIPFWMKDTLIPLDIAFIDSSGTINTIQHGIALDETPLPPSAPYLDVIETNAGWFAAHGLGVGSTVVLPPGLPRAEF